MQENIEIEQEIHKFLNRICKIYGICDPLYDLDYFVFWEHYKVDDFVREIFLSEGLDPDLHLKLSRQVKKMFTDQFGAEIKNF
jgi:hypothetical protein